LSKENLPYIPKRKYMRDSQWDPNGIPNGIPPGFHWDKIMGSRPGFHWDPAKSQLGFHQIPIGIPPNPKWDPVNSQLGSCQIPIGIPVGISLQNPNLGFKHNHRKKCSISFSDKKTNKNTKKSRGSYAGKR
jgi:hypothetical protein